MRLTVFFFLGEREGGRERVGEDRDRKDGVENEGGLRILGIGMGWVGWRMRNGERRGVWGKRRGWGEKEMKVSLTGVVETGAELFRD